jgi:tagatose 1,6-diphosphate aldolase
VLQTQGLRTLQDLMDLTREAGHAWTPDYSSLDQIRAEGDLCSAYA